MARFRWAGGRNVGRCLPGGRKVAAGVGDAEKELVGSGVENALLDEAEFDVEDGFEFGALELAEDDQLIEAVHEFGREFAARSFDGGALDFLVDVVCGVSPDLMKP